jgi:hypothetical protein
MDHIQNERHVFWVQISAVEQRDVASVARMNEDMKPVIFTVWTAIPVLCNYCNKDLDLQYKSPSIIASIKLCDIPNDVTHVIISLCD